jgi:predicted acyl esterase
LYWCYKGYAVANVDVRGAGHSEGSVHMFTHQDREDGYDFVEWVAAQPWSNGRVGMSGNSGVAMHQWGIAATCPPHLACIAPWECTTDLYRESFFEGGVPALSFNKFIAAQVTGPNGVDDQVAMAKMYPDMNAYWNDKRADVRKVKIPVYQTAGWSHFHLPGSFNAWRRCRSHLKWMRAHRDFEWPDTYNPENLEDLLRYYDRYLKGIHNGWEMTPRVRLDVMDGYDVATTRSSEPRRPGPIKRTQYEKLYLDASAPKDIALDHKTACFSLLDRAGGVSQRPATTLPTRQLEFDLTVPEDMEVTGYMNLRLYVSCEGHNEMDLFVNIQKAAADGTWIPWYTLDEPHPGAWGKCRVSRRELDEKLSKKHIPILSNTHEDKLEDGKVYPVDIAIVPTSRVYHKGERFRVQIAGRYIREGWFEPLAWDTDNGGTHTVHTGGDTASYIEIPVVEPRYVAGDYVRR